MGYSVMFYSVDIARLQGIYGSNDETLLNEILEAQAEELGENDEFFEEYEVKLNSRSALRQIFAGTVPQDDVASAAMYAYVLKIICEHLGEFSGGDLYSTRILPMESRLMANGAPIPIPDDSGDFPEVGYLTAEAIRHERQAAENALPPSSPHFFDNMKEFTHHRLSEDELLEELETYKEILDELADQGLGTVAFRH